MRSSRPIPLACAPWLGLLALLAGCGGAPGALPPPAPSPFPEAAELERITRQPLPDAEPRQPPASVERWRLEGPFPADPDGPPPPDALGATLVMEAASSAAKAVPTASLHCVARELARFVATHQSAPSEDLQGFIANRCGSPVASLAMQWVSGEVGPDEAPPAVLERWAPGPADGLERTLAGLPPGSVFGGAFAEAEGRAVWLVVAQRVGNRLTGYTGLPDGGGMVAVRGRARRPYPMMEAVVTRGRFGYAACVPEIVEGDAFGFRCPVEPTDGRARIEVAGFPEGAVLGDRIVTVNAWPTGAPIDVWQPPPAVERRPVDDIAQVGPGFVEALNALRAEAGLPALLVDEGQSQVLGALGPYYWSAVDQHIERAVADRVVLGTMAGYRVTEAVERGHFAAARLWGPADAGLLLRTMLASPSRRRTLFAPGVRVLATGATSIGESVTGLVVGTYRTFDAGAFDVQAAGRAARTRLDAQRAAAQLGRLAPWPAAQARLDAIATTIGRDGVHPQRALDRALSAAAAASRQGVTGLYVETSDLDQIPLPEALRTANAPPVAVAAGFTRAGPHPWVRHVVLLVWPGQTTTAALGEAGRVARRGVTRGR